jgi:biopolymer transport protein ExbB/TolQ
VFDFNGIIIKGGPVMVPLLACSIISLAVVIERMIFWRKARSRAPVEELLQLVELASFCRKTHDFFGLSSSTSKKMLTFHGRAS